MHSVDRRACPTAEWLGPDAPCKTDEDLETDSIEELKTRRTEKTSSSRVDEDETDAAEGFELPCADLSGEELSVQVLPRQQDEFTCTSCLLVEHRSQLHAAQNSSDDQLIRPDGAD
ncbi:DUF4193 domain-containing protein [Kineococcus sp. GCM10028916]|uniref:DUF4193 domain-containing protein n=1 Tax=Kineococcus sp. GCM10028916 TaxID=3273394 RepID=UPI003627C156